MSDDVIDHLSEAGTVLVTKETERLERACNSVWARRRGDPRARFS